MKKINKTIIVTLTILSILLISGCVSPSDVMDNLYTKNVYPDVIAGPFTIGDVGNPYGAGYFDNLYINGSVINSSGMIGPQGPQGLPGINGTNGINGSNGIDGTNGTNGIDGAPGINGTNGTNGTNGVDGAAGATGPAGPNVINNSTQTTFTGFLTGNGSYVNAQSLNISIDANGNVIVYGTLTLSDTVWDDLRIVPGSFDRPGTQDPAYIAYIPSGSGITTYLTEWQKTGNGDLASFTCQIPHGYKVGEDIYVHIHWTPGARGNEESGNSVGWKIQYTWANIDGTFATMGTANLSDICDGTDHKHQMTDDVQITGSGKGISSMLICNILRSDTGADDTWVSGTSGQLPMLLEVDFHYPIDTMGSSAINAK